MKKISSKVVTPLAALIALALAPQAFAQTITASDTNATINSEHVVSVTIDREDAVMRGFVFTLDYDTAFLSFPTQHVDPEPGSNPYVTTVGTGGSDFGCTENTVGTLFCIASTSITSPTFVVNIEFTVGADAVDAPGTALDLVDGIGQTNYVNDDFEDVAFADVVDGSVVIAAAAPDVVLGFNPTTNVVFPGGVSGTTTDAVINVTVASGAVGTGTIDNCVVSGPNAGAFTVVTGAATAPPADTLELEVTLANTALAATLTCDLDDASAATTKVFQLSAPAGTPVPAPEYSSSPAPGSTINCNGPAGSQQFAQLTITNSTDFPGVGSNLDYTCAVAGAGFTLESAGSDSVEAGSSSIETFGCTVPGEGEPAAEGTVTCTSNDAANSPAVYDLSSIAATALPPVPQPNVVPASSLWSQLSLIGLMAALGLLVVGLRRKG